MNRKVKQLILWCYLVLCLGGFLALGGCNTVEGLGNLVSGIGEDITLTAKGYEGELAYDRQGDLSQR